MAQIILRMIRAPARQQLLAKSAALREEVKRALDADVKKAAVKQMETITSNWEHQPGFIGKVDVTSNAVSLYVEPVGPNAKYWEWTSAGTSPHIIAARYKPYLVFRRDYAPKTTPAPSWGGPGTSSGAYARKKFVRHPGTRARKFEAYIKKRIQKEFRGIIENATRRALRR